MYYKPETRKLLDMPLSSASRNADRQDLDLKIQQLETSLHSLESRRNLLATINTLPNEVLASIFLASRDFQRSSPFYNWGSERREDHIYRFENISGVCSLWRKIAVQYPSLWSEVNVKSPKWTELQLIRSRKATLTLLCESTTHYYPFLAAFSENIDRVSSCKVKFDPSTMLEGFMQLLGIAPPILEAVEIVVPSQATEDFLEFDRQLPYLRKLRFSDVIPL